MKQEETISYYCLLIIAGTTNYLVLGVIYNHRKNQAYITTHSIYSREAVNYVIKIIK